MIDRSVARIRFPFPFLGEFFRRCPAFVGGMALFVCLVPAVVAETIEPLAVETAELRDADTERPALPVQTRIAVKTDTAAGVAARVTLVFPHNGFAVTDWGEPEREGNRIGVDITVERRPAMLPVVTKFSHTYVLGLLPPGDYGFEVSAMGHPLAGEKFTVREDSGDPPPPATARLRVSVLDDGTAKARVEVAFREPGYRVVDWGEPMRRGSFFSIHAKAVRIEDRPGPASDEAPVLKQGHTYRLWPSPLSPGEYSLEFFLNGRSLADTKFRVSGRGGSVALHVRALTEAGRPVHPMRVVYRHPDGIDTESLGDRNIRVTGPDGYDRFAALAGWVPLHEWALETGATLTEGERGVVATYHAHAPGRFWNDGDNGMYGVRLADGSVRTKDGGAFAGRRLGRFAVEIRQEPRPWVEFHSLRIGKKADLGDSTDNAAGAQYGAKLTLLVGSPSVEIEWGDVTREGNRLWVDVKASHADGPSLPVVTETSHIYRLGELEAGHYHFVVFAHGRRIGEKRFTVDPEVLPAARVLARDIREASRDPHVFQIRYFSPYGMDLESIRAASPGVRGPHGYSERARLLALDTFETAGSDRFVQGSYEVAAPPHGWTARANGSYGIFLPHRAIHDLAGNYLAGGRAGGFKVMIRPGPPPGHRPRLELDVEQSNDGMVYAHLRFLPGASGWAVTHWGKDVHMKGLAFVARAEIDENPSILPVEFHHSYRLGRLKPGVYRFVWYGSNGFVSRHIFRVGGDLPAPPFERWRDAVSRLAAERGTALPALDDSAWLYHYAFAGSPADPVGRSALHPRVETAGNGKGRLVLEYPEEPYAADVDYRVELSTDLREWTDASGLLRLRELRENLDGTRHRVVEIEPEPDGTVYRFARLRASLRGPDTDD
ncbi:MAG: hypothetical protein JJU00_19275 [Opitutales bacterium]|nr:hypothetical protein [Opitutales bacterium]